MKQIFDKLKQNWVKLSLLLFIGVVVFLFIQNSSDDSWKDSSYGGRFYLEQGFIYGFKDDSEREYHIVLGVVHITEKQYNNIISFDTTEEADKAGFKPSEVFAKYYACFKEGKKDFFECDNPTPSPSLRPEPTTDPRVMLDEWRSAHFRSSEADLLKKAIPKNSFLRDLASLQGEDGFFVLYILNPNLGTLESVMDGGHTMWCGASDFGQTIHGTYKLALIRDGKIVNEVGIPFADFDAWPDHKLETPTPEGVVGYTDINDPEGVWKNEGALMFRHARCMIEEGYDYPCSGSGLDFIETRQLQMMDLTGDGLPHEVRFMTEYLSCGNRYYVVAGYDKKTDKVMIFNIIDKEGNSHPAYDDFIPRADGSVIHDSGCDHGATRHTVSKFKFDVEKSAYVMYSSTGSKSCGE